MKPFNLAQINIAQLVAPLHSPELADFVANLDRINALADHSPGFVWRFQSEDDKATSIIHSGEMVIVNMSVWSNIKSLHDYVYRSGHVEVLRRRGEWFNTLGEAHMTLWWVPSDHLPSLEEGKARLHHLKLNGPTQDAFTFKQSFPAPDTNNTL